MTTLLEDALVISDAWSGDLDLRDLIERQVGDVLALGGGVDVIALGKAAREMASALHEILGARVRRQLVIVDEGPAFSMDTDVEFVIGEHPRPGLGSLMAGERLVAFLERPSNAECTIFLVSGGASSLCALPSPPMDLDDLHELFAAALQSGADITTLNQLRAATSSIAGGAILRHVRTPHSLALIMIDNVVSGERWVASGLTFEYRPTRVEVRTLLESIGRGSGDLADTVVSAFEHRRDLVEAPVITNHANRVIADPSHVLDATVRAAIRRGFRVVNEGAALQGDVQEIVERFTARVTSESLVPEPFCVVGVGEATVRVRGSGLGGRCQEIVWRIAGAFGAYERDAVAVARSTDGRDYVRGIAGGWVDTTTLIRARDLGIDWATVVEDNDSFHALQELDQLIAGGRTGWNLCDVYLVVVGAS